jgi:hypothetical protein
LFAPAPIAGLCLDDDRQSRNSTAGQRGAADSGSPRVRGYLSR